MIVIDSCETQEKSNASVQNVLERVALRNHQGKADVPSPSPLSTQIVGSLSALSTPAFWGARDHS